MTVEYTLTDKVLYYFTRRTRQLEGMKLYAVLDNARDERIFPALREYRCEYRHLYVGALPPVLERAAPHVVEVNPGSAFARWLIEEGWGMSWGIFLASPARLDVLKNHFRELFRVRDEKGKIMYFRYFDPRVFRVYLPTCTRDELRIVFGEVRHFFSEGEDRNLVTDYWFEDSKFFKRATRFKEG